MECAASATTSPHNFNPTRTPSTCNGRSSSTLKAAVSSCSQQAWRRSPRPAAAGAAAAAQASVFRSRDSSRRNNQQLCIQHVHVHGELSCRALLGANTGVNCSCFQQLAATYRPVSCSTKAARGAAAPLHAATEAAQTLTADGVEERVQGSNPAGNATVASYVDSTPFSERMISAIESLQPQFLAVDGLVAANLRRVIRAFGNARVGRHHFGGTTGYGHNDSGGREALDGSFAEIVGAEAACVRSQFFSGTHAIAAALFAVLRPGDELLSVVGAPYDTLEEVIGLRGEEGHGSLREFGVDYRQLELLPSGSVDWASLSSAVQKTTKVALVQRSCGYSLRETLSVAEIGRIVEIVKAQNPECVVVVDNCYGEFMEAVEPTHVGADLIAGSLIKNPGGTIAPCGGYVAGRKKFVEAAAARLSAPGIGSEAGATSGETMRLMFQGLFLGPQMTGEAIKSSLLTAEVMHAEGYRVRPQPRERRRDIIQAIQLGSRERQLAFAAAVQRCCPVGSYVRPTAGATAGYGSEVVFADGTFIDGSTSELSCDGPLREPYAVYCQGGTHWSHWAIALEEGLQALKNLSSS